MKTLTELQAIFVIALVYLLFVGINVNQTLGIWYLFFLFGSVFLYSVDKKKTIVFDKDGKWLNAIFIALGAYALFIIGSSALSPIISKINITGVIKLLAATTPALSTSKILNAITFALPVAFLETIFFVRLADFFASRYNISTDKKGLFSFAGLLLIAVLSFGFLMYHVTSKGIEDNLSLMLVFFMMFISLGLVFWFKESKQAILFHIIANSIASYLIFFGI